MTQNEALRLALEALEKLWNIIDDIDTYSDMAKADEKLYRSLVERRQRQRFEETGISTDGYELHGGAITAIKAALEAKDEPVAFKIYKPTPPRGAIPNVRDAELPWVYDQDPSSGNVASMWVTPVKATPPQRKPLTVEEIAKLDCYDHLKFARAIEAAHGIKGQA